MRIRSRLLLLVSAVLAPSLLGAAIGLAYVYKEEREFHAASMQETARALALALDREMGRREDMLRTLGDGYKALHLRGQSLSPFAALYLATLGGALGAGLESDDTVRAAAYTYRRDSR